MVNLANKALTIQEKLVELLGVKEDPSVSIIVNKNAASPRDKAFRIAVKNAMKEAIGKLNEFGYDKRLISDITERFKRIEEIVAFERDFQAAVIFLSPQREEILFLPFEAKNKVIVDNSFEIRDLLRTVNRSFQYDVIVLSKKKTAYFNGFQKLLQKVEHPGLPEGTEYYFNSRVSKKIDPSKAEEEAIKLYVNDIDHFIRIYSDLHTPLIVMGEEKLVSFFKKKTKRPDKILAEIYGSYDSEKTTVIRNKINEKLQEYIKLRDRKLMERIQDDINKLNYVSGIQEAWTVAAMKEARILLVEHGYKEEGYSVRDGLFLVFEPQKGEDSEYHADVVDDLAEMVLRQGGEVYFMTIGMLKDYDKVILTTRT